LHRAVTLTQLKVFVLVTRLGSVKAAATTLGVSEPAVSQALAALRQHLGDPLIVRAGSTMELTPAGQRVVGIASQMVSLAVDAELAARASTNAPELLRVVASSTIADSVAPSLLQLFTGRVGNVEISLGVASTAETAALLQERLADVALGPRPVTDADGLVAQPLLRWRLVLVAGADHPAVGRRLSRIDQATQTWLIDPAGRDPASVQGALIARLGVADDRIRVFPNQAAALAAAARGAGVVPAVDHLIEPELEANNLVRLDADGTPAEAMWFATTMAPERRAPMAARFMRFLSTPDALHEMHRVGSGVPAARFRPPVYVTIWS
jgi:DNA-binding transcriptional LysR family regulator